MINSRLVGGKKSKQPIFLSIYRNWMLTLWVQCHDFNIMTPLCFCLHRGVIHIFMEQSQAPALSWHYSASQLGQLTQKISCRELLCKAVYAQKEYIKDKFQIFTAEKVQYSLTTDVEKNPRYRKTPSKDITGLKIKLGRKLAHDQSPEDCFEAWCKIHCFSIIQDQSEYSFVDIVLIDILIDLLNANIVLIVKAHVVTSSLEHLPLAIWSSVGDLLSNKLPLGCRFAKAQYILISVSKLCNTIIRLGVKQGNFSALYKVLNNNFVKFWLQYIIC